MHFCAQQKIVKVVVVRPDKMCVQKKKYFTHKHETQEKKYMEQKILNLIKEKCAHLSTILNEKKKAVRDIFYSVLSEYPDVKIDFYKHERGLQMIRSDSLPKNPLNCNDISKMFERKDTIELLGTTKTGDIFYNGSMEGNDYGFCVFSSPQIITLYQTRIKYGERVIMMDGTFAIVPVGSFDQLLVIYAVYLEKVN